MICRVGQQASTCTPRHHCFSLGLVYLLKLKNIYMQPCPQLSCSLHLWLSEPRVTGTILRRLFLSLSGRTPTQLPFSKWCQGSHSPADVVCAHQCHTQHGGARDRMTVLLQWGELVRHVLGVGDADWVAIVHSRFLNSWTITAPAWLPILTGVNRPDRKLCASSSALS